jgi:predicted RNase H-like nuclease (RuvC/YqgF family)
MGAARLAAVQVLRDPVAKQYLIDHHAHQKEIRELKEQAAAELNESRHNFTSQLVAMYRQLIASRAEIEALKNANRDLQQKLQEQDVELKNLRSVNADLEKKVRGFDNVARFFGEIARGEIGLYK